jgi:secondary thiamine-phosphate synthase enzyme
MKTRNKTFEKKTSGFFEITDITDDVVLFVKESEIKNGLVNVQTMHTTAMIILNENEPLLLEDIKKNLEKTASSQESYNHDNFDIRTVNMCNDECQNGHSHCKAIYLSPNVTLNLINGETQLGQWQRVLFIELDRARDRRYQIQIIGE